MITCFFREKHNSSANSLGLIVGVFFTNLLTFLRNSIEDYVKHTNSAWGKSILDNFDNYIEKFLIVKPKAIKIEDIFNEDSAAA